MAQISSRNVAISSLKVRSAKILQQLLPALCTTVFTPNGRELLRATKTAESLKSSTRVSSNSSPLRNSNIVFHFGVKLQAPLSCDKERRKKMGHADKCAGNDCKAEERSVVKVSVIICSVLPVFPPPGLDGL